MKYDPRLLHLRTLESNAASEHSSDSVVIKNDQNTASRTTGMFLRLGDSSAVDAMLFHHRLLLSHDFSQIAHGWYKWNSMIFGAVLNSFS